MRVNLWHICFKMTYVKKIGDCFVVMIESIGLMGDYQISKKFKSENVANEYSKKANKEIEKFDKRKAHGENLTQNNKLELDSALGIEPAFKFEN